MELEDAQRQLLELQGRMEYCEAMVSCVEVRIRRLTNYLGQRMIGRIVLWGGTLLVVSIFLYRVWGFEKCL
jgi:hypothetical protein